MLRAIKKDAWRPFAIGWKSISAVDNPACPVVALDPVRLAHVFNPNFAASSRRMQETVVAEVDADVRESTAHGVEEYEIARFQFVAVNGVADFALLSGRSGEQLANGLLENQLNKTAAIEPAFRVGSTETIMNADEFNASEDQVLGAGGVTLQQRRLITERLLLFGGVGSTDAGQGNEGCAKQRCEVFVTRHGCGI